MGSKQVPLPTTNMDIVTGIVILTNTTMAMVMDTEKTSPKDISVPFVFHRVLSTLRALFYSGVVHSTFVIDMGYVHL